MKHESFLPSNLTTLPTGSEYKVRSRWDVYNPFWSEEGKPMMLNGHEYLIRVQPDGDHLIVDSETDSVCDCLFNFHYSLANAVEFVGHVEPEPVRPEPLDHWDIKVWSRHSGIFPVGIQVGETRDIFDATLARKIAAKLVEIADFADAEREGK